jgi:NAD(P)-dependent dehydrogenase (short-subunit alcohol dehydrogenase family)
MTGRLEGKVFMVTGAESGIGRAIALRCLSEGAAVTAAGIDTEGLAETAEMAGRAGDGARVLTHAVDVRDHAGIQAMTDATVARFGKLDGAVANAGIVGGQHPFTEISLETWDEVIRVNLTGVFLTLQAAARVLLDQGAGGSLLATGSSTAVRVAPGLAPYIASKGGIHALVEALALELAGHGIRVNTIVPGTTRTPLTTAMPGYLERVEPTLPMKAAVEPEELAAIAAFALSDEAPHMTGTLLKVDSGRILG